MIRTSLDRAKECLQSQSAREYVQQLAAASHALQRAKERGKGNGKGDGKGDGEEKPGDLLGELRALLEPKTKER